MIKIKMTDLGKDTIEMLHLGIAISDYLSHNASETSLLSGKGYVSHGPGSRSIQVRYDGEKIGPENIHEIRVKDASTEEEQRIARELVGIYKKHSFSQIQ